MEDRDRNRKVREAPLAELTGIQFGVVNEEDIMTFSVFERDHTINGHRDLWDGRLGIYNLPGIHNLCITCGAKKASDCGGHFGHITLPAKVYHPLHMRFLKTVLNKICLVCQRFKEKKEVKKGTFEEKKIWMEIKKQLDNAESLDSDSDAEIVGSRQVEPTNADKFYKIPTEDFEALSTEDIARVFVEEVDFCESADDGAPCKYCGAKIPKSEDRYPELVVFLSKKADSTYETFEMRACVKEEKKVPLDYWTFVHGNPGGREKNIRPLFPFEALTILRKLSEKVIRKLGMDARVATPEAFILSSLPVPPSGSRITEVNINSCLPRTHMDQQHMHLQRFSSVVNKLQNQITRDFAAHQNEVMQLQTLASDYLNGSKWENGLKYKAYNPNPIKQKLEKDDKLMKNILSKTNNSSARMIVVGDPSIKIEEILLPVFMVEYLTIPEKVTTFNRNRLQQYVDNGYCPDLYKTGAVLIDKRGGGQVDLRKYRRQRRLEIDIGDTVHRHIKEGDLVIVNRPPSLSKHSLIAMQVRLHLGCSSAVNPVICASFQADFDGDCMHIYFPQSLESLAELHSLMKPADHLINPQGGQSNNILAEDSRLGAYLISSSCLFLDKTEMCQLTSSSFSLPIPAILKSPKENGPLWTGQQLYSTVLPKGICYTAADKFFITDVKKGILIRDGELLVCNGNSNWLGNAPDALTAVISKNQGPAAALAYLNQVQELANMYIRDRGFTVGLQDLMLTRNRSQLLRTRLGVVIKANREALMQTLLEDENVQREELKKNPTSQRGLSAGIECSKSKGLFLGTTGTGKRSEALDKVTIDRFQKKFGKASDRLARDYCNKENPVLVMIDAGSKGSMIKLVSQSISLGLQLYKGEHLLPWSAQDLLYQRQLTDTSSSRVAELLQGPPLVNLSGYWESRGIITSSYLDGLFPLQFFTHCISSRYGMLRSKVEEPNILQKRLLLFLRNLHMGYDGTVRNSEGQHIVQFGYGGLLEMDGQDSDFKAVKGPIDMCEAGEPVGILAATSIMEPAYQMKLDSPHNVGAKAIGPLDLIKESLSSRKTLAPVDMRVLLRMPLALRNRQNGQEKGATRIQQHLKPVTLDMMTSTTMIEYRKTPTEVEEHGRKSPWLGHIRLSVEKLEVYRVLVHELLTRLENRHSTTCSFSSSNRCRFGLSPASQDKPEPCIHFYTNIPAADLRLIADDDDERYNEYISTLLEVTKSTLLPLLMSTLVKGDERIQSVTLSWEDMEWHPRCAKIPLRDSCEHKSGEVVVEVTVKKNYCRVRGKAWEIVKEACLPIMQLLDWQRCTPYSIKELNHVFGLEAAKGVLLQRLELAVAGMGKRVNLEHLKLIADTMVASGEVNGASSSGYLDLCKTLSRPAPFAVAAHENPKNNFLLAARIGACETIEGALSSSIWGKAPSLGTGSSFGVLWQVKAEGKPTLRIQQGVDIHESIAKINSFVPCKGSSHHGVNGRRLTRSDLKMDKSRFRRSHGFSRHIDSAVPTAPSKAPCQPKMATIKIQVAGHQDIVVSHAGLDPVSDDGSNSHPPATFTVSTEELVLVNSRTERPEDSSSFHTPNETLETHSTHSDSPCSSFRKDLHPPNFPESNASEGDQMSSVSQPPLETIAPIDEVLGADSYATTQHTKGVELRELQGLEACGSISPIEERSSRKVLQQRSNFTMDTSSILNASTDAFHLTSDQNDEWKRLEMLHREVNAILFRKYDVRQRLKKNDQRMIMEKVLPFHPDYAQKIGCGVDHIKVDYHQSYSKSRCFFVVRNDESVCDFSYLKCLKSFANTKSPALAMKYDHEQLMKHERDDCSDDVIQLDPFGSDPSDLMPPWSPLPEHDQLGCDLTLPKVMKPNDIVDCDGSKSQVVWSKPKEESSCETSELKPGLERPHLSS